jgi:hypothetical protein
VRWKSSLIWDGGVRSVIPLSVALAQKGVEEVWVIGLNPSADSPMRQPTSNPLTGLQVLARTIEVYGNNVSANDIAKMRLLVDAWEERAHIDRLMDVGNQVLEKAKQLPESLRIVARKELDQLAAESQARDTILGASKGDQRSRVQVFVLQPSENLPGASLRNTLQDQRRMYLDGVKDATEFLDALAEECAELTKQNKTIPRSVLFRVFSQGGWRRQ